MFSGLSPAMWRLGERPGVTVTGSVPDVRPFLERACLTVAPLSIARGTQNKILESMAMGVPVVASAVAAGGVDAIPGEQILIANDDAEFGQQILNLLEDVDARNTLSTAARQRMVSHHNWASSMAMLDKIVELAVSSSR